ncbi:MAG: hypothetical protein J7K75_01620 [Desulfuromonas sp.]|nr:hypothetical protein [Desulfuromonas sp.]
MSTRIVCIDRFSPVRFVLLLTVLLLGLLCCRPAYAVNWFMLQGTEKPDAPALRWGGFLLLDYQRTDGGDLPAGPFKGEPMMASLISPNLRSSSEANVRKFQLGMRGALSNKIAYSVKTISGNNAASRIDDNNRIRLVESSVTFSYIPGARVRLGMFKTPSVEESLGFVPPCNYINLTNATNMLMQERFFEADGTDPGDDNQFLIAGCCRDIGIMLFDSFTYNAWELSYAAMLGNGHGLQLSDKNDNPDLYLYLAAERLRGVGKGVQREGWKMFGWYQEGQRTLEVGVAHDERVFRRCRYGVGTTLLWQDLRMECEIVKAHGMIFAGTDGGAVPGTMSNNGMMVASYNILPEDQALGWYFDIGCRIFPEFWLNARYDRLDLGTETHMERQVETVTLGVLYKFSRHLRGKLSYEIRNGSAPHQDDASVANQNLDDLSNRFAAQMLYLF